MYNITKIKIGVPADFLRPLQWVGSETVSGTHKNRSWIRIRNKSFRIHNTAKKVVNSRKKLRPELGTIPSKSSENEYSC